MSKVIFFFFLEMISRTASFLVTGVIVKRGPFNVGRQLRVRTIPIDRLLWLFANGIFMWRCCCYAIPFASLPSWWLRAKVISRLKLFTRSREDFSSIQVAGEKTIFTVELNQLNGQPSSLSFCRWTVQHMICRGWTESDKAYVPPIGSI
jgi:hypothetical protein